MTPESSVKFFRWSDMPKERVTDQISRRLVTGERMMLAHVYLGKGSIVPKHSHENEQLTYILEGALHFWIGEDEKEEIDVRAGEVLWIPSNLPHKALALEDTLDVDVFSPPRQDWLNHTDSYFHRKQTDVHLSDWVRSLPKQTIAGALGIEVLELTADRVVATMPVDDETRGSGVGNQG